MPSKQQTMNNTPDQTKKDVGLLSHMNRVYAYLCSGMIVSAIFAWVFGNDLRAITSGVATMLPDELLTMMFTYPVNLVIVFSPLAIVFSFIFIQKMSINVVRSMFYLFSTLMGISLASVFVSYTDATIFKTFLATAIGFAGLSVYGYTTKRDMSGLGTFFLMGLLGLIGLLLLNMWIASSALEFGINVAGLLLFAGLTAYDTQKIKTDYLELMKTGDSIQLEKSAIMGALSLYLDFINMFMFMLNLFGERD